ncbi:MAG: tetratricopeptide repeat protein, partial [Bacteroidales bacterium]|nr:tetratricopeptide repeat protein [Bacteroidales bacterium]
YNRKALELNPEYPEAIYNLGAFYVNQGIEIQNQARNLPLDATAEYDALSAQANTLFQQSIPYLEKIVEAQPNNVDALNTLRGIYIQLNQMDKANEIKARVDALTGVAE